MFAEPFCGGAGAAMNLLADGVVDQLALNDADVRVYSAWFAILNETERFIDRILAARLDIDEWYEIANAAKSCDKSKYSFELGFASFYLNRTTHSGIIERAGPIGGYNQTGKWKIDARFNKNRLSDRVKWIASQSDRIVLSNSDALGFIDRTRRSMNPEELFFFVDPPYVKAGGRLYLNGMDEAKHIALSDLLSSGNVRHWLLTYDDDPLIRDLYSEHQISHISVNYSLKMKRKELEVMVVPRAA